MTSRKRRTSEPRLFQGVFRSHYEQYIAEDAKKRGFDLEYETVVIPYDQPSVKRKYHVDFLLPNGILIEAKGGDPKAFTAQQRRKYILVKEQYPDLDLRFVFSNPDRPIYKGSPTTYAMWAEKNGFIWAHDVIPEDWFHEANHA